MAGNPVTRSTRLLRSFFLEGIWLGSSQHVPSVTLEGTGTLGCRVQGHGTDPGAEVGLSQVKVGQEGPGR